MNPKVYIGTSGFSYKSWDRSFYPPGVPKKKQLEYYSTVFPTVEINATFYRLPSEAMVRGWNNRAPEDFVYAVKGSRFITHMKKIANLGHAVEKFFDRIYPMQAKTPIILWQLPPNLKKDLPRLDAFLDQLPSHYTHAVEFRHLSWYEDDTFELLKKHRAPHVALSSKGMPMNLSVTTEIIYIRFHGLEGGAAHDYTIPELQPWAEFIAGQAAEGKTLYVYFNNDINVRAPDNALQLMKMVSPFAVPAPQSAEVITRRV